MSIKSERDKIKEEIMVLNVLRENGFWMQPTEIGVACGRSRSNSSSWSCRILTRLMVKGFVKKNADSKYRKTEKDDLDLRLSSMSLGDLD